MREDRDVDYLSVDDLLEIATGILGELALLDAGLLASAAARPATTVFGADAYPAFADKAAALVHSLARNHPLVDGNKRLGWAALRSFCLLNGTDLRYGVDEAEAFVLSIAAGESDVPGIADWLAAHFSER
ncbi:MAG: type II toxin-antitoxin system death-on-curing family toxin [Mycobacteriales bacterium]